MALKYLYQGKEISRDKSSSSYKQTLYGTETEVDAKISSLTIGTFVQGKGYLKSWTKTQNDPNIWQIEIEYSISYESNFNDSDSGTVTGKKSAQLSVRNIQMPLQAHPNYRTIWNHYLISCNGMSPSWVFDKTDTLIDTDQRKNYMWVKSLGEIPLQPNADGTYWEVAVQPQKPGVEYYDMALFVVTISEKHGSATSAGNAVSKNINRIVNPSEDFNLGGEWKYDEASISYDGKNWISTQVYTRAADEWDKQLYG